jgi:hypothetical protein
MKKIIFVNKYGNKFVVSDMELAEAIEKYRPSIGLDARWLPDYLEGAETRQVLVREATEAYEVEQPIYNENMEQIGTELVMIPATSAQYNTEYLHPAEYTYEIVEESLAVLKARKIAELNRISENSNPYIHGNKFYRTVNIANGKYIKEGNQAKHDLYVNDFLEISSKLVAELARCTNLVNACTIEAEVIGVTFNL